MKAKQRISLRHLAMVMLMATLMLGGACLGRLLVPDTHEIQIGLGVRDQIENSDEFTLLNDPEVDAYINEIAQQVLAASPLKRSFPFTFKVCVNDTLNAFALPGGFCYVHTGLIEAAETEAELVGVIAHEVSHVTCEHHRAQLANEFLISTAQDIVFTPETPVIVAGTARVFAGLGMMKYNRTQESEADRAGVEALYIAGWNPRGLRDFFETLQQMQMRNPTWVEGMLSSHPANAQRIAHIDALIDSLPPRNDLVSDSPRFQLMKQRVRDLLGH